MATSIEHKDGKSAKETFAQLAKDFDFDARISNLILAKKMKSLRDFRFWFSGKDGEDEIKSFVAEIREIQEDPDTHKLQTSKLRQAWASVHDFLKKQHDTPKPGEAELEDMLQSDDLEGRKKAFWTRYKSDFANEEYPADQLISRVARETQKRMLLVYDIALVKNLLFQITTHKKKKQAVPGADLWTHDNHDTRSPPRDWLQYLSKLFTYLVALAIAGCQPVHGCPEGKEENVLGADSTVFIEIPLDVVQKYFNRARFKAMEVPEHQRLDWLRQKDQAERALWAKHFQQSNHTLGQVIRMVYNLRDAHWEYQAPIKVQPPQVADYGQGDTPDPKRRKFALWSPPPPQGKGKGANKGKAPWTARQGEDKPPLPHTIKYGNAVATETAQGIKICEAFQDGQCQAKGKGCMKGKHICGVLTNKAMTSYCGGAHGAREHRGKGR